MINSNTFQALSMFDETSPSSIYSFARTIGSLNALNIIFRSATLSPKNHGIDPRGITTLYRDSFFTCRSVHDEIDTPARR